ncbi:MAG: alcohol dehydrogenase catalytic domain-containing protein [Planctomycetota bacterium]|nr:alcohol dehydrogenase catalytic domain-containing protein [Planctomycetota bacterium]
MRALTFNQSLALDSRRPDPPLSDGDTLIRVRHAGICSTDLEITKGYMAFCGVLGHEFTGTVLESPNKNLLKQRVVGEINIVCGRCDLCVAGLSSHCRKRATIGIHNHDGCFADLLRLPAVNLHILPDSIDDDQATFIEPLAAAFQVLKQIKLDGRRWVTVLGDGRLGLLVAQVLQTANCPVRVIGKHLQNLALCEKWSIRSRPLADIVPRHDQDVVVDCTGSPAGFELALQMVRPRGTIVLKSTCAAGKPLNLAPLVIDEITLIGSRCGQFKEAIIALAHKQIDVVSLIHRRIKLDQALEAMQMAARPGVLKVILTME